MKQDYKKLWGFFAAFALAALAYLPALKGNFHFDDFHHIVDNPAVKNFPGWWYFFGHPEGFSVFGKSTLYRPLTLLSFALNYRLAGKDPGLWLIVNLLLHSLNAGLVFLLLKKWTDKFRPALIGGILFAVMPILSQPVNYLSNRATLLAAVFVILGLLLDRPGPEPAGWKRHLRLVLTLVCFWLALLSKELAAVFPALVLISDLFLRRRKLDRERIFSHILFWLSLGILFLLRFKLFGTVGSNFYPRGFQENALIQAKAVFLYLAMILWPIHLSILPEMNWIPAQLIFSAAVIALLSGLALIYRKKYALLAFGWFWFLLALLPGSLMPLNVLVNEERVYLPALGVILALAWLMEGAVIAAGRRWYLILGLILLCNLALLEKRIPDWRDEKSLWREAIRTSPRLSASYVNYANVFSKAHQYDRAIKYYQMALACDPDNPQAFSGLCRIYLQGQKPELLKELSLRYKEVSFQPYQKAEALSYQAVSELLLKNNARAEELARQSLELNGNQAKSYYVLGVVSNSRGDQVKAEEYGRKALGVDPDFGLAHALVGLVLSRQGRSEEAVIHLEKYVDQNPEQAAGWFNLGMAYYQDRDLGLAEAALEKSVEKNPKYPQGYYGLALVEWAEGKAGPALESIHQSLSLDPELVPAHQMLAGMLLQRLEQGEIGDPKERRRVSGEFQAELKWLKAHHQETGILEEKYQGIFQK